MIIHLENENYDGEIDITFLAYDPYRKIENERLITFNDLNVGDLKYIKSIELLESLDIIS